MLVFSTLVFVGFLQTAAGDTYRDCLAALYRGNHQDGEYTISPDGYTSFRVFCDQTTFGGGWVVIQRHSTGQTSFQRTTDEYKNGFGNISKEFWIGNKYLRILTSSPHHLLVQLRRFDDKYVHAHYESFSVGSESSGYKLHVSGYSGSAGDALIEHNDEPFSVRQLPANPQSTSGWWHSDSAREADLNAPYNPHTSQRAWKGFRPTFTEIKIKPERERSWDSVMIVRTQTVRYPISGNFSAFSACWWMRTSLRISLEKIFSIEYGGLPFFVILMRFISSSQEVKVFLLQNTLTFNIVSKVNADLDHLCIVISSSTLSFYVDGKLSYSSPIYNTKHGIPIPQGSELVIGGAVHVDGLIYPSVSHLSITNLNAWDKSLSESDIFSMSGFCHAQTGPRIVAWPEVLIRANVYKYTALQCVPAEAMHWTLSDSNGTLISDQRKTRNGTLSGSKGTADTKLGVLGIQGQAQADLGDISDTCLGEPDKCDHGLTLRFWMRHREKFLSKILGTDANYLAAMDTLLQGVVPHYAKWRRCYHGDTDGFSARAFHSKCDYKGPTVTVIRVGTFIFGGFSDQHWGGQTQSIPSVSAFLFSIKNLANKLPFKMKINESRIEQALYNDQAKGPGFGQDLQIGFEDISTVQRYSRSSGLGTSYKLPQGYQPGSRQTQDLLTGSSEFSVDDMEVFYYDVPHKAVKLGHTLRYHDSQFSASSEANFSSLSASEAKMSRKGWCSYNQWPSEYLKLNFSRTVEIRKIEFTGSEKEDGHQQGWLTSVVMIRWSTNDSMVLDLGSITDPSQKVMKTVDITASSLLIQPKYWEGRLCMRIEAFDNDGNKLVESLPDEAMTASSYACETSARRARLSFPWQRCKDAWCASPADVNPWVQIDLVQPQVILFVETQGSYDRNVVLSYVLKHSMNGSLWYEYQESGRRKIFVGNSITWTFVKNAILRPFQARLLRLVPLRWQGLPCIRLEIYTQVPECQPVNSNLVEECFTASSNRGGYEPKNSNSTYSSSCWIPDQPQESWLQIDLLKKYHLCCIEVEGINEGTQIYLTTSFKLSTSNDTSIWADYESNDGETTFEGNTVNKSTIKLFLYPTPRARFVRIYPRTYVNMPCLRVKISAYADATSSILSTNSGWQSTRGLDLSYSQTYLGETFTYTVTFATHHLTWRHSLFLHPGWHQVVIKWNKQWGLAVFVDKSPVTTYGMVKLPAQNEVGTQKLVVGDIRIQNGQENLQMTDIKYWSVMLGYAYIRKLLSFNRCSVSNWGLQSTNEGNFQWQQLGTSTPTPYTGLVRLIADGKQKYENFAHLRTTITHTSGVTEAWRALDGNTNLSYARILVTEPQWWKIDFGRSVYVFSVEIVAFIWSAFEFGFVLDFSSCETLTLEQYGLKKKRSTCSVDNNFSKYFSKTLTITFTNHTAVGSDGKLIHLEEVKVQTGKTTGALFVESSLPRIQGDKAYLRTRTILNIGSVGCVYFRYFMNGKELGKLSAYKESYDGKERTLLWRKAGEDLEEDYARFQVHSKEPFQIVFEGVVGPGFLSDIVIYDKVTIIFPSTCEVKPSSAYLPRKQEIVSSLIGHMTTVTSSLEEWLSQVEWGERYWRPCYSSQKEGWNTTFFHNNCDNAGPTITLVKAFDHVFGAFTDNSWGSANDTHKSSTKAFLFSFKGIQNGFHIQYKIRQNYTFAQFLTASEGPAFGDSELAITENMRIVKANPLKMFGNSNNGLLRITENKTTLADEVEVLHLKDSACPETCELYKTCDEYTGRCVCDTSIPLNRMCEIDNLSPQHLMDAVFYWPLDGQVVEMKGRAWYSTPVNTINQTNGVLSRGIRLRDPTTPIDLGVGNTCFAFTDNCTDGLTISLWMVFDEQSRGILFSSGSQGYGFTWGVCMGVDTEDFCLNITALDKKCSYRFTSYRSYWNHYVITLHNTTEVLVYLNGQRAKVWQNCVSANVTRPASSRVTLAGNAKFDELIVWYSVFNVSKVENIYGFYDFKDKKAMEVFFVFRLTSRTWTDAMKDKESVHYQGLKESIQNNALHVYSTRGLGSKIKSISLQRLWNGSVYANLSIVYSDAIYDLPELLYDILQQTGHLGYGLPVDSLAMHIHHAYNKSLQVEIVDTRETSLTLRWSAANENARALGTFQGYQVIGSTNGSEFYSRDFTGNTTRSLTLKNLSSCTEYVFTVRVFSLVVYGKRSAPAAQTTLCAAPNIAVTGLHGYNTSATSIHVQWDPVPPEQVPGVLRGYRVYYTPSDIATANVTVQYSSTSTTLVGLQPYTNYTITVLVYNGKESKTNVTTVVTTDESVPVTAPPGFAITSSSPITLMARWQKIPIEQRRGILLGYKLTYGLTESTVLASVFLPEQIVSHDFSGLSYDTQYTFNISGYTSKGFGPITTLSIRTGAGVPYEEPDNLTAETWATTSTIPVRWLSLSRHHALGEIQEYFLTYQAVMAGDEDIEDAKVHEILVPSNLTHYLLSGLDSYTKYRITVAAITKGGRGPQAMALAETCHCGKRLSTNWMSQIPYVNINSVNSSGIIPETLENLVSACCKTCKSHGESFIDYRISSNIIEDKRINEKALLMKISHSFDMNFPIHGYMDQYTYKTEYGFAPIVESPGVTFIVKFSSEDEKNSAVLSALSECWPMFTLLVILIWLSGIMVWFLDCNINPQFSAGFLQGSGNGIWWSFITMTTVGYGDRFPMSVGARIFTVIWSLTGIILLGILNASFANSLTSGSFSADVPLYGCKVGAIQDSPEHRLGIRKNAKVNTERQYTSYEDIANDLHEGRIKGALIDTYVLSRREDLFDRPSFRIMKVLHYSSAYGAVLGGDSRKLTKCFKSYMTSNRATLFGIIQRNVGKVEDKNTPLAIQKSFNLLDSHSKEYADTVLYLLILLAAAIVLGFLWSIVLKKTRRSKATKNKIEAEIKMMLIEFNEHMELLVKRLKRKHAIEQLKVLQHQADVSKEQETTISKATTSSC